MKKQEPLSPIEESILRVLVKKRGYMTTAEIADEVKISWNTAEKHLSNFKKKKWVIAVGQTKRYWKAKIKT